MPELSCSHCGETVAAPLVYRTGDGLGDYIICPFCQQQTSWLNEAGEAMQAYLLNEGDDGAD